jgi:hypothetical protein
MALIDRMEGWIRSARVQTGVWVLCTLALFLYLRGWSVTRDLELRVKLENVGPVWVMDWGPARGAERNGHWIDLGHGKGVAPGGVIADPQTPVLRVRIANYDISDVGLRWVGGPAGAKVTVSEAFVDDSILGVQVRRTRLSEVRVEGAGVEGPLKLPVSLGANEGDGGVYFACSGPAWWYQVPVLVVSGIAMGIAWALIVLLVLVAKWMDTVAARLSFGGGEGRGGRVGWAIAALVTGIGIPIWLTTWAPMLISGDSTAYILHAYLVHENGNFNHFDGWRLPGYAVLILPFFAWMSNYAAGVAWAQMFMGMLSPLLAWGMLRGRVAHPWPYVAAILVAVDPGLFIWQRTLLTEAQVTLFVMLSAYLFLGCVDRVRGGRGSAWVWAVGLALALAAGCYTRPNIQVFGVLGPLALAAITVLCVGWRRLGPAAVCAGVFAGCMAPIVVFNAKHFDTPAVTVGSDWNREVWGWENGVMDWNQSGFFTYKQFAEVRAKCEAQRFSWWDLPQHSHKWDAPPAPAGLAEWAQIDYRCGLLWRESAARRADGYVNLIPRAIASMFGWPAATPAYFHGDPYFLSGSLMGDDSHSSKYGDTNYLIDIKAFPKKAQGIFERAMVPIGDVSKSPQAGVVRWWYNAWLFVRPGIAALMLLAIVRLVRVRELGMAALGVILIAHMVAVPVMVFTGSDRYAMPWYGVMTVVVVAGMVWRPRADSEPIARS